MSGQATQHTNAGRATAGNWNLNHVFGRLGIRTKLTIAFLLLAGTPLALVGWYAADQHLRSLHAAATAEQQSQLEQMQRQVETLLIAVRQDLAFLGASRTIAATVGPAGRIKSMESAGLALLGDILVSKPYYYRVRLLAPDGSEVLHVVRTAQGPSAMPAGKWRGTGYRYYKELIRNAAPDTMPFNPVEIRGPTAAGQEPTLVSSISFARAIELPDQNGTSLLVADVYASALLGLLGAEATGPDRRIMLVGPSGHFLYHSSVKTDWNTLLASQGGQTLAQEFGAEVADEVLSGSQGLIGGSQGWVVAYARVFGEARMQGGSYRLVSAVTEDLAFEPVRQVSRVILVVGALTLLLAGGLAFAGAHQFTAPIRQLQHGAARVAAGDFTAAVSVDTNDELEDLGRSFMAMASALEVRESELVRHTEHLESMVEDRTRELRESQAQMIQQEKMVAVGQLAAGVAHELGTPLAAILCHGEMALEALEEVDGSSEARESLRTVVGQAERTRQIVRSLLDFSRPSSGDREAVSLSEVVTSAGSLLQHDLQLRGVELVVAAGGGSSTVLANRNELEQLVINLVRNAADAMPGGGQVRVAIESAGPASCEVVVEDQGTGIAATDRDRVFEPFFTTKPPGEGTGLGLWVSYNIAREYGGSLEIRHTGPAGTIMVVRLPLLASKGEGE